MHFGRWEIRGGHPTHCGYAFLGIEVHVMSQPRCTSCQGVLEPVKEYSDGGRLLLLHDRLGFLQVEDPNLISNEVHDVEGDINALVKLFAIVEVEDDPHLKY